MSKIEKRIVEMQFDNKQFEKGVSNTLTSLDELKKGLELDKSVDGLNKAFSGFDMSAIEGSLRSLESRFSTLGIIGMTVIQDLTRSAMNSIRKVNDLIMGGGKRRALNIEQAKFQFEGLGMDVEQAMEDSLYAVKGTAYGLDEAAIVASSLGASGVKMGDDMKRSLRGVSGLAAMTNSSYGEMGSIFTTVAGQGKLMTMQMRQIEARGVNVAAVMAESMGTTEGAVREMVQKGQIDFDTFSTIMNEAFGEHATKANETFTGSLSNVKAALSRMGAAIAAPQFDNLRHIFNALIPVIDGVYEAMEPLIEKFTEFTTGVQENLVKTIEGLDLSVLPPVFNAIGNALKFVLSLLKPVGQAFRDIFPKALPGEVKSMAKNLESMSKRLKLTDEASEGLRSTFKGMFAIVDLLGTIFQELVKAIFPLASSGAGSFVTLTGAIGEMVAGFAEFIKDSGVIQGAFEALSGVLQVISDILQPLIGFLFDFTKGLTESSKAASPLTKAIGLLEKALKGVGKFLKNIGPSLSKASKVIFDFVGKGSKMLIDRVKNMDFASVGSVITTGLMGAILLDARKTLKGVGKKVGGKTVLDGVKDVLGGVTGALKSLQEQVSAETLMNLAKAIAILAGALLVISFIPQDKIVSSLLAIATLFGELMASMMILDRVLGGKRMKGLVKTIGLMTGLAGALVIMALALRMVAKLKPEEIGKGLFTITIMVGLLVASAQGLSRVSGDLVKASFGLILFASALKSIARVVGRLGSMDGATLAKGLGGLALILLELQLFLQASSFDALSPKATFALILLGTAIQKFAKAVSSLGGMPYKEIIKGVAGLGAILLEVSLLFGVLQYVDGTDLIKIGVSMIFISKAVGHLAKALGSIGEMSWSEIGRGLTGLAGGLMILAVATKVMSGTLRGGMAMIFVSLALRHLVRTMIMAEKISWKGLAKGLATLAGTLVIFGLAAAALTPLLGPMAALAGILVLVGIGLTAISVALASFSVSWAAIQGSLTTWLLMFIKRLEALLTLIPKLATAFAQAIIEFVTTLGKGAAKIGQAISDILKAVLTALRDNIPLVIGIIEDTLVGILDMLVEVIPRAGVVVIAAIVTILEGIRTTVPLAIEVITEIIQSMIDAARELIPEFIDLGFDMAKHFLEALSINSEELTSLAIEAIVGFIDGVASQLEAVANAGANLVISFINAIAEALRGNAEPLGEAMANLFSAIIEAAFGIIKGSTSVFKFLWDGIMKDSILGTILSNVGGIVAGIAKVPIEGIKAIISRRKGFQDAGDSSMKSMNKGILSGAVAVIKSIVGLPGKLIRALKDRVPDFRTVGGNMMDGIKSGMEAAKTRVVNAAKRIGQAALNGTKRVLDIHSPSRKFNLVGVQSGQGLEGGLLSYVGRIRQSGENLGEAAYNGVSNIVDTIMDVFDDDIDMNPVITPVLDMDSVVDEWDDFAPEDFTFGGNVDRLPRQDEPDDKDSKSKSDDETNGDTNYNIVVNNPVPEEGSDSIRRTLLRYSFNY